MKTIGQILATARRRKKLSFFEVEEKTKIRKEFLQALEGDDFEKIPGGAIVAKGFIRNFGQFLGLSPQRLLAIFRRDFIENEKGQILPRGYFEPLNKKLFSWNPRLTALVGIGILILTFFVYLGFQATSFLGKPPLSLEIADSQIRVNQGDFKVLGKTDPDASVEINGKLTEVGQNGDFEKIITLFPGENTLIVEATSRRGKKTRSVKTIFYEPSKESTPSPGSD